MGVGGARGCRQGSTPRAPQAPPPRSSLPEAVAPPSASVGSGPDWPLVGSVGTALPSATSAGPAPPPGRVGTRREGKRGREKAAGEEKKGGTQ